MLRFEPSELKFRFVFLRDGFEIGNFRLKRERLSSRRYFDVGSWFRPWRKLSCRAFSRGQLSKVLEFRLSRSLR